MVGERLPLQWLPILLMNYLNKESPVKKSLILLPLAAAFALAGCTSSSETETAAAEVSSTTAIPTWQSSESIQSAQMPASMTSAPSQTLGQAQTAYSNAQTTYNNAQSSYGSQTESIGNCQVVRDSMGTPIYSQMTKGCYTDSQYTVGKTDTLFLISFLTGKTPAQIAAMNNISTTTKLKVGQTLQVR